MAHVLVIDDSPTVIAAIKRQLEPLGLRVAAPQKFAELPAMLDRLTPVAIVLDLNMPALRGEQVGRFLEREGYVSRIIVHSSEDPAECRRVAEALGAQHCVAKQSDLSELSRTIQAVAAAASPRRACG